MPEIVVLGGGVVGLATAMMLAQHGHNVTVLERDSAPVPSSPEDAWHAWARPGVAQFRQPHFLHAAARHVIDHYLPDVMEALLGAGCTTFDSTALLPASIADRGPRAGDERFVTVTGRRPIIEYAFASVAARSITVIRGIAVAELLTAPTAASGIPHIMGVRAADGREFKANLVVDAMGRRSHLPDLLVAAGCQRPYEEAEESGFIYYTRYFRATSTGFPAWRAGLLTHYPSFSLLTLPCDANTWSVTVFIFAGDPALKVLRYLTAWTALVRACPLHAHWLDGEPISDVLAMGGVTDRYRRFVINGAPIATGVVSVGDAWACTNPVGGRGISMGLIHAGVTAEVVQRHLDDPLVLALAQDVATESRVTPWFKDSVRGDRKRTAQIAAAIDDQPLAAPQEPEDLLPRAMLHDAELFRAFIEVYSLLALPGEVLARPGITDRIRRVAQAHEATQLPCPSRQQLLHILA